MYYLQPCKKIIFFTKYPFNKASHPSLMRTFGFSMISTYNLYFPSIFGKNALIWCYFQNIWEGHFKIIEVKGGRMVKERDFEAEKNQNKCKKIKYPTLFSCVIVIFLLEIGQKSTIYNKNQITSTSYQSRPLLTFSDFWVVIVDFDRISSRKKTISHNN
jgi:hypothetical protein